MLQTLFIAASSYSKTLPNNTTISWGEGQSVFAKLPSMSGSDERQAPVLLRWSSRAIWRARPLHCGVWKSHAENICACNMQNSSHGEPQSLAFATTNVQDMNIPIATKEKSSTLHEHSLHFVMAPCVVRQTLNAPSNFALSPAYFRLLSRQEAAPILLNGDKLPYSPVASSKSTIFVDNHSARSHTSDVLFLLISLCLISCA